jgi:optic atrophy 3 protein
VGLLSCLYPGWRDLLNYYLAFRAIDNGANFLAEGFLFSVAAALIISETWRSSRSQSKQRSDVNGSIEELQTRVRELSARLQRSEDVSVEEQQRYVFP